MNKGIHGEKIVAILDNEKLPQADKAELNNAILKYNQWISDLENVQAPNIDSLIDIMVNKLNDYKNYIDINLIFDSKEDFLYRQKGQLKLDNTIIEEFMPIFVRKCIEKEFGTFNIDISSQTKTFSSIYFSSDLSNPKIGGGIKIKTKDQDFSMSRKLYIKSSYNPNFPDNETEQLDTNLGYVLAEIKTNLDKTMFQEACATAHDVKLAISSAKYYLLCDYLDMTPINTATTDIDEILILRKAKRISSNIRKSFDTYEGRVAKREWFIDYLMNNPYNHDVFKRLIEHIFSQINIEELNEDNVLSNGYF